MSASRDVQCVDLELDLSDDAIFEGVVPSFGGAGLMTQIFCQPKEEPTSSDDELDSTVVPQLSDENPLEFVVCKRGPGYIGAYSPEQRRERIARFHEKRLRRVWKKRVTYSTRKNIANKRMRVKGRFIKKEEESMMRGQLLGDDGELDDLGGLAPRGAADGALAASDFSSSDDDGALADDGGVDDDALGCMLRGALDS